MAIEARCEKCDKKVKVKDELAGKKIKCPGCGATVVVPAAAAEKQELNPDLNSTESIINLNLKKFKHQEIDPDDEDFDLDQIEGAIANRRKRELAEKSGPPKEPLEPIDWVLCLMCSGLCGIWPIMLLVQGKRSRGMKALGITAGLSVFWIVFGVLFAIALGTFGS